MRATESAALSHETPGMGTERARLWCEGCPAHGATPPLWGRSPVSPSGRAGTFALDFVISGAYQGKPSAAGVMCGPRQVPGNGGVSELLPTMASPDHQQWLLTSESGSSYQNLSSLIRTGPWSAVHPWSSLLGGT